MMTENMMLLYRDKKKKSSEEYIACSVNLVALAARVKFADGNVHANAAKAWNMSEHK
jgi:hypothetical protein